MSGSYGVAFPTGGTPYPTASNYSAVSAAPQQQVQIQPGSITYTTTTTADGRIQYNQFRAEARSYQTPQGPVHGIQWVPVNISYEPPPPNAQAAGPEFHSSWSRSGNPDKEAQRALKEWQRDQEKRAKKEEKESAKRMKEWERERREREKAEEKEFRRMQERDLQRGGRPRRLSDAGYAAEFPTYSAPSVPGYARARSRSRVRRDSAGGDELTRAMAEMAMDKDWPVTEPESRWEERERRNSVVGRSRRLSVNERPRRISTNEYERTRKTSGTPYPTSTYLAGGQPAYGAPSSPGRTTYSDRMSPYMGGGGLPSSGMSGPVYPPGHIYAGKPIPGMPVGGASGSYRVPSPSPRLSSMQVAGVPGSYRAPSPSPRLSSRQPELPVGFTRLPSLAVPYTYFEPIRIMSDLNGLFQELPPMPAVLAPHDVWHEDWIQCFEDIARTWVGKWPDRVKTSKKLHKLVADLVNLWNASFFSLRGVELILSRGRLRLTGPHAGRYDDRLGSEGSSDEESDTISSVSSDSDAEDRYGFYGNSQTRYGASGNHWLTDSREARRARKARKLAEKQKKRKLRERERGKGSGYALHLSCIGDGQPSPVTYPPVGYPS